LFTDAPKALLEKIEQVVRLIRSKGVGVYFVTQNPLDVPEKVLAQLGNRVQHALRAYTPREQKAVQTAAETFRPNPDFDCAKIITQLGVGEALVSTLGEKAVPSVVQRTLIRPPASRIGPITDAERKKVMDESPVSSQYDKAVDRESAFEMLQKKAGAAADAAGQSKDGKSIKGGGKSSGGSMWGEVGDILVGSGGGRRQSVAEAAVKSVVRSVGSSLGRALVRGILGGLTRR
jgi:DNA helicase HerA-like ATPase